MLQVNNLTVTQNRDQRTLISDLSFSLLKGDKLAVIGAEGNGKTALLRIICEPELASVYLSWQGHIDYAPYHIGYLAQETPPHLYDKTVEVLTRSYISDGDLYRFADELMLREDILFSRRTIESLSGGERMKLRLLLVRLERPRYLCTRRTDQRPRS